MRKYFNKSAVCATFNLSVLIIILCGQTPVAAQLLVALSTNGPALLVPVPAPTNGVNGVNGTNGTNGLNGSQGVQGTPGVNGTNITTGNFTNAVYFHSNTVPVTTLRAGFTNGSFALVTISNALQAMWMSNNVLRWKKLAP